MFSIPTNVAETFGAKGPKLTTNMLAFQRSLEVTEAIMTGVSSTDLATELTSASSGAAERDLASFRIGKPVSVVIKGVRGQSSHYNAKTTDLKPGASNPQISDFAMLPQGTDTLDIRFSLLALPNSRAPSSTDSHEVAVGFAALSELYTAAGGYRELAARYIANMANGRIAWRNQMIAQSAEVRVVWKVDGETKALAFNPFELDMTIMATEEEVAAALTEGTAEDLAGLIDAVTSSLAGTFGRHSLAMTVTWSGKMLPDCEVYPSQEYTREDAKGANDKVARNLSSVDRIVGGEKIRVATMHSQKIGAALRCIDDWHGSEEFLGMPIPVNPYAGVQEMNICLRDPNGKTRGKSFYALLKKPDFWEDLVNGEVSDDVHYVMANLVRGGVFGMKGE